MEERKTVYFLLMCASGIMGAYTYVVRGGVFCNAQTGNLLMMGLALSKGSLYGAGRYLVAMIAYFLGAYVSEWLRQPQSTPGQWNRMLAGIECVSLIGIGCLPASVPDEIVQVLVNFLCSMQYNTFRQARGIPMATTFCTNHVRQMGVWIAHYQSDKNRDDLKRAAIHLMMLSAFVFSAALSGALAETLGTRMIWLAALPLAGVCILLKKSSPKLTA